MNESALSGIEELDKNSGEQPEQTDSGPFDYEPVPSAEVEAPSQSTGSTSQQSDPFDFGPATHDDGETDPPKVNQRSERLTAPLRYSYCSHYQLFIIDFSYVMY